MHIAKQPALLRQQRQSSSAALRRLWIWWTTVNTNDPVRASQNKGFLVMMAVLIGMLGAALLVAWRVAPDLAPALYIAAGPLLALYVGSGLLARQGRRSGIFVVCLVSTLLNSAGIPPSTYAGDPVFVHALFLFTPALATVFLSLRMGLVFGVIQIAVLAAHAVLDQIPTDQVLSFVIIASINMGIVIAIMMDATRRFIRLISELEQRVVARTADLQSAKERIEHSAEARAKETAEIVHDSRHLLRDISAHVEGLLLDAELAGVSDEDLEVTRAGVQVAIDGMRQLLNAAHEASLLHAGALTLKASAVDFRALTQRVIAMIRPRYENAQIVLSFSAPDNLPLVWCDEQRMVRVLQNVLTNAQLYTNQAHSGTGTGQVQIRLSINGAMLVCAVTDNGPGIAPEDQQQVFSRFHRIGGARGEAALGLGLPLTRQFVEAHGGEVALESALGEGTSVTIAIPRAPQ